MKQLLITRRQSQSREIVDLLQKENFSVFCEPLFSVKKIKNKISLPQFSAVILTSANAILALEKAAVKKDVKIFTVGKITAKKLRKKGFKNLVISAKNSAQSLVTEIAANKANSSLPLLYFHGSVVTLDFATELKKFGIEVKKILAYETKEKRNFSKEAKKFFKKNRCDYALIFSQNSLRIFAALAKKNNLLEYFSAAKLLCLSPKILEEAGRFGFKNCGLFQEIPTLSKFYG